MSTTHDSMQHPPTVIDRMLQLWNGEELDPGTIYAPRCLENGSATFEPYDVVPQIEGLRSAMPDLTFVIDDWFSCDDRYVLRMHTDGTLQGPLQTRLGTAPPTRRTISMTGIEVFRVAEDRIIEVWVGWNFGELYESLGATLGTATP